MARPTKQGIDYFPLDCRFDDKIEMYLIEKGAVGLGVLISIWQMIYSNEGYFISNNKDLHLLIKKKIDVDINEVSDCINICLDRNIFDRSMHKNHQILTSKAIQKRYFDAAKKKKSVQVCVNYVISGIDSGENVINVGGNATNVNIKEDTGVNGDGNENVEEEIEEKEKGKLVTKPDLFDSEKPTENLPEKSAPKKQAQSKETKTGKIWEKYSAAYFNRYGTEPVRNATVNGQLSKIIDRIGKDEAHFVAEYFVSINNSYYVQRGHGVGILLADCEKIRTEWATNRSVTSTQAQQIDKTQTNGDVFQKLIAEAEEEERLNEQKTTH